MGLFSIFGDLNIKASDGLLKKLTEVIELYVFVWLFILIIFWAVLVFIGLVLWIGYLGKLSYDQLIGITPPSFTGFMYLTTLIKGFTLFMYLPSWIRILLVTYISVFVISIPITILIYAFFSNKNSKTEDPLRKPLKIRCVECKNKIEVPIDWLNGETDIRCAKCRSLMTLTLENGEFKRLILKQATKYSQDDLSRRL